MSGFQAWGLHSKLLSVLSSARILSPTSIQTLAIPSLLSTRDHHFLAAQTGTGKTLAYLLPFLHSQIQPQNKHSGLIVTFSRELVLQLDYVLETFKGDSGVETALLYAGQKEEEWKPLLGNNQPKLVFGTIDKVVNLTKAGELSWKGVHELVIDECDTLVDCGKVGEIEQLITQSRRSEQNVRVTLVSATFPRLLEAVLDNYFSAEQGQTLPYLRRLIDPKAHFNLHHLKHEFILLEDSVSAPTLLRLVRDIAPQLVQNSAVLFCNSIESAKATLALLSSNGYEAVGLHGDISPKERLRNYRSFRNLEKRWLVCTDLGSRGLDFPAVSHVLQCDFPKTVSDYLHRAGRTGRCYRAGTVMTLYRRANEAVMQHLKNSFHTGVPLTITSSAFS